MRSACFDVFLLRMFRRSLPCQVSEGGFYDRERLFWRTVRDAVVTVAAAPPGGARSTPSARLTRLFSVLCLPSQNTASNTTIFG